MGTHNTRTQTHGQALLSEYKTFGSQREAAALSTCAKLEDALKRAQVGSKRRHYLRQDDIGNERLLAWNVTHTRTHK